MKYSTAVAAALAAGVSASYSPGYEHPPPAEYSSISSVEVASSTYVAPPAPSKGYESSPVAPVSPPAYPTKSYPSESWVTEVLTAYTTYCPESTEITHGGTTYSVTEATTLTITGPVTVTYPVTVSTTLSTEAPPPPPTTYVAPSPPLNTAPPAYSVPSNGTVPKPTGTAPAYTSPSSPAFTGAASALKAGSAGVAAIFGLVAYAL